MAEDMGSYTQDNSPDTSTTPTGVRRVLGGDHEEEDDEVVGEDTELFRELARTLSAPSQLELQIPELSMVNPKDSKLRNSTASGSSVLSKASALVSRFKNRGSIGSMAEIQQPPTTASKAQPLIRDRPVSLDAHRKDTHPMDATPTDQLRNSDYQTASDSFAPWERSKIREKRNSMESLEKEMESMLLEHSTLDRDTTNRASNTRQQQRDSMHGGDFDASKPDNEWILDSLMDHVQTLRRSRCQTRQTLQARTPILGRTQSFFGDQGLHQLNERVSDRASECFSSNGLVSLVYYFPFLENMMQRERWMDLDMLELMEDIMRVAPTNILSPEEVLSMREVSFMGANPYP